MLVAVAAEGMANRTVVGRKAPASRRTATIPVSTPPPQALSYSHSYSASIPETANPFDVAGIAVDEVMANRSSATIPASTYSAPSALSNSCQDSIPRAPSLKSFGVAAAAAEDEVLRVNKKSAMIPTSTKILPPAHTPLSKPTSRSAKLAAGGLVFETTTSSSSAMGHPMEGAHSPPPSPSYAVNPQD